MYKFNINNSHFQINKGKTIIFISIIILCIAELSYSQVWSTLGTGMPSGSYIYGLTTFNNELIAGGGFTTAGGVSAKNIAKWNGTTWSPLGTGMNGWVLCLIVFNNELIAGGDFTTAGGDSAKRIAKWNGTSWAPLESGFNDAVRELCIYNGELIAGGSFTTAGGVSANRIAKWNGTSWSPLGSGMNNAVSGLCVFNNELVAGGSFTIAGGATRNYIAKWNGTVWNSLGSGMDDPVHTFNTYNGDLIAGGSFINAGGVMASKIARWNGTSWNSLSSGLGNSSAPVNSLEIYNGELIAGGNFYSAGGSYVRNIARWNGTSWSVLDSGIYGLVSGLCVHNGSLIAGGNFLYAGQISANNIAKWTGPNYDVSAGPFVNLPLQIQINSTTSIKTRVTNVGNYNQTSIPVKLFINGALINTANINLNNGQSDSVSNDWTPSAAGTYTLMYVASASIDSNRTNDTVRAVVNVMGSFSEACIGNGSIASYVPFPTYYMDSRTQMLFTASELTAAGAGINKSFIRLGFNIALANPYLMNGFNIKFQHTSLNSLSGWVTGGWTTVYSGTYSVTGVGWQYINLTAPFFVYDGTSNLLVEICYDNTGFSDYTVVRATSISGMTWRHYVDNGTGCSLTLGGGLSYRPNTCFTMGTLTGTNSELNILPLKFSLSQNYPNPFNPVTRIKYDIPKQGFVSLKVYDVMGREVKSLVNEMKSPGNYSVDFNGSELTSGVYFYKIQSGDFTDTKRMMLIK